MTEEVWTGAEITRAIKRLEAAVKSIDEKLDSDRFISRIEWEQRREVVDREFGKVWTAQEEFKHEVTKTMGDFKRETSETISSLKPVQVSIWQICATIIPWLAFLYVFSADYFPLVVN